MEDNKKSLICSECGTVIEDKEALFCPACGVPVKRENEDDVTQETAAIPPIAGGEIPYVQETAVPNPPHPQQGRSNADNTAYRPPQNMNNMHNPAYRPPQKYNNGGGMPYGMNPQYYNGEGGNTARNVLIVVLVMLIIAAIGLGVVIANIAGVISLF